MELNYKSCLVLFTELEGGIYAFSIYFGETLIYPEQTATGRDAAKIIAVQLIDAFIGDLPPALSYKPF